jgi:ribA/ribD-fused uncharacterized protein
LLLALDGQQQATQDNALPLSSCSSPFGDCSFPLGGSSLPVRGQLLVLRGQALPAQVLQLGLGRSSVPFVRELLVLRDESFVLCGQQHVPQVLQQDLVGSSLPSPQVQLVARARSFPRVVSSFPRVVSRFGPREQQHVLRGQQQVPQVLQHGTRGRALASAGNGTSYRDNGIRVLLAPGLLLRSTGMLLVRRACSRYHSRMSHVTEKGSFVFFWSGWPSQWYPADFAIDGVEYGCAEQFMMAEKARLFGDKEALHAILRTDSPVEQKALGRTVRDFDEARWTGACREVVYRGNIAKFSQNPDLLELLLVTGDKTLVEASPKDRIWGIGLAADDPRAMNRSAWRGKNWLGEVLMRVRAELWRPTR